MTTSDDTPAGLRTARRRIGPLDCTVVDTVTVGTPDLVVVLCHGYEPPGDDLVGLAPYLIADPHDAPRIRMVFPMAPIELDEFADYGGRAWWPISVQSLVQAQDLDAIRKLNPKGIDVARRHLGDTIKAALHELDADFDRLILGGFSQGAMLALDWALESSDPPRDLLLLSSTLIDQQRWTQRASECPHLRILQSHGRLDPVLPFALATELADMLESAGHDVDFMEFLGPHSIPQVVMEAAARRLSSALAEIDAQSSADATDESEAESGES